MSDEVQLSTAPITEQEPATPAEAQNTETPETTSEVMIPKSRFDEINKRLRAMEKEAEQQRKAAEATAQAAAAEQGKYKELWEEEKVKREAAERERQAVELARLKDRISAKHQLPAALADRLRGETEEELETDAQALLDAMPKPQIAASNDASSGINSSAPKPQMTEREITETAARLGLSISALKQYYGVN